MITAYDLMTPPSHLGADVPLSQFYGGSLPPLPMHGAIQASGGDPVQPRMSQFMPYGGLSRTPYAGYAGTPTQLPTTWVHDSVFGWIPRAVPIAGGTRPALSGQNIAAQYYSGGGNAFTPAGALPGSVGAGFGSATADFIHPMQRF